MIDLFVQLGVIGIWGAMLVIHTRRLVRLAQFESIVAWQGKQLRYKLNRIWWWLGREEYWRDVQVDGLRCMELTLMFFLVALSI